MWQENLLDAITGAARPPDRAPIWEWCERNIEIGNTSPMPGPWRLENSPQAKRLLEAYQDKGVREIIVQTAAQVSKTQTAMNLVCWGMSEDPGPTMWFMPAQDEAETFVRDRLGPQIKSCKRLASQIVYENKLEFTFRNAPLYASGAGSKSKVSSKPIRYLFIDEACKFKKGMALRAMKRVESFWNSKTVITSTPELKGDFFDVLWRSGTCEYFFVPCACCGEMNEVLFDKLKWDTNETTCPGGQWNWDALAETIRFECPKCGYQMRDIPHHRRYIVDFGRFVATNQNAPKHRVSIHWSALIPPLRSWLSIVRRFIEANAALKIRNTELMRDFINEVLGLPWEDRLGQIRDFGFLEGRKADYTFGDAWSEERIRFMGVDRQASGGEHYWWVIRAFGLFGKSRLVAYGRAETKDQLLKIAKQYNVRASNCVIDTGYRAADTYQFCVSSGWNAFKGDQVPFYLLRDPATKKQVRMLWHQSEVDPAAGTIQQGRVRLLPLWRFATDAAKDSLMEYMMGFVGEWTIPRDTPTDYLLQASAEERRIERNTHGQEQVYWHKIRDNHLLDCELQIHIATQINKSAL